MNERQELREFILENIEQLDEKSRYIKNLSKGSSAAIKKSSRWVRQSVKAHKSGKKAAKAIKTYKTTGKKAVLSRKPKITADPRIEIIPGQRASQSKLKDARYLKSQKFKEPLEKLTGKKKARLKKLATSIGKRYGW